MLNYLPTFEEYKKIIETINKQLLNAIGESYVYQDTWKLTYISENINNNYEKIKNYEFKENFKINNLANPSHLNNSEILALGFANWNGKLFLYPLYLVPFFNLNQKVESISGNIELLGDCDKDSRGGFIAYGFYGQSDK